MTADRPAIDHVPCEQAHPGYGHEEWLGLGMLERIDRAEAAQGAAPLAEGLDVERLAKALEQANHGTGSIRGVCTTLHCHGMALTLRAEYARLSGPR